MSESVPLKKAEHAPRWHCPACGSATVLRYSDIVGYVGEAWCKHCPTRFDPYTVAAPHEPTQATCQCDAYDEKPHPFNPRRWGGCAKPEDDDAPHEPPQEGDYWRKVADPTAIERMSEQMQILTNLLLEDQREIEQLRAALAASEASQRALASAVLHADACSECYPGGDCPEGARLTRDAVEIAESVLATAATTQGDEETQGVQDLKKESTHDE